MRSLCFCWLAFIPVGESQGNEEEGDWHHRHQELHRWSQESDAEPRLRNCRFVEIHPLSIHALSVAVSHSIHIQDMILPTSITIITQLRQPASHVSRYRHYLDMSSSVLEEGSANQLKTLEERLKSMVKEKLELALAEDNQDNLIRFCKVQPRGTELSRDDKINWHSPLQQNQKSCTPRLEWKKKASLATVTTFARSRRSTTTKPAIT